MKKTTVSEPPSELVRMQIWVCNARLRDARQSKHYSYRDLALLTGLPEIRLQKIEKLRILASQEERDEISSALDYPTDYLFPRELDEAVSAGVFERRKATLNAEGLISLTEAKRSGCLPQTPLLEAASEQVGLREKLREVVGGLRKRDALVLNLRFGLDGGGSPLTYEEMGKELQVTRERTRQIEARGLRALSHPSRSKKIKEYYEEGDLHDFCFRWGEPEANSITFLEVDRVRNGDIVLRFVKHDKHGRYLRYFPIAFSKEKHPLAVAMLGELRGSIKRDNRYFPIEDYGHPTSSLSESNYKYHECSSTYLLVVEAIPQGESSGVKVKLLEAREETQWNVVASVRFYTVNHPNTVSTLRRFVRD